MFRNVGWTFIIIVLHMTIIFKVGRYLFDNNDDREDFWL